MLHAAAVVVRLFVEGGGARASAPRSLPPGWCPSLVPAEAQHSSPAPSGPPPLGAPHRSGDASTDVRLLSSPLVSCLPCSCVWRCHGSDRRSRSDLSLGRYSTD